MVKSYVGLVHLCLSLVESLVKLMFFRYNDMPTLNKAYLIFPCATKNSRVMFPPALNLVGR